MPFTPIPQVVRHRLTTLMVGLVVVAIAGGLALQQSATADIPSFQQPPNLANPTKYKTLTDVLPSVQSLLLKFVGAVTLLAFMAGAYSYFLSGGNEEQLNKGRQQMVGSLIAFFIVVAAAGIVSIFEKLFKTGHPF